MTISTPPRRRKGHFRQRTPTRTTCQKRGHRDRKIQTSKSTLRSVVRCLLLGTAVAARRVFSTGQLHPQVTDRRRRGQGPGRCADRSSLAGHPLHASSCRDNLQQPVAPRREGPWVPSPSHTAVFGPPPLCTLSPPTLVRIILARQLGRCLFGMPAREL